MAYAHDTHRAQTGVSLGSWLSDLRAQIAGRIARYRVYRTTLSELSSLSDRDLHDLGLHRAMIGEIAYEASYKA